MKYTNIGLTITEWVGFYGTRYFCYLFADENGTCESRQISIDEARIIQWELLKKGAKKTTEYNPYRPHIYTRKINLLKIKGM